MMAQSLHLLRHKRLRSTVHVFAKDTSDIVFWRNGSSVRSFLECSCIIASMFHSRESDSYGELNLMDYIKLLTM